MKRTIVYALAAALVLLAAGASFAETAVSASVALSTDAVSADVVSAEAASTDAISTDAASADAVPVESADITALPRIYQTTIGKLNLGDSGKVDEITLKISNLLAEGKDKEAAVALGAAVSAGARNPKHQLGLFCASDLQEVGDSVDDQIKFMLGFIKGYRSSSVLVFTKEGAAKYKAYGNKRGAQWQKVTLNSVPNEKTDRIYESDKLVFIPFKSGDVFKIDLYGKAEGAARMWKIMPGGVNTKSWPGGVWEREVTVRGDKLF